MPLLLPTKYIQFCDWLLPRLISLLPFQDENGAESKKQSLEFFVKLDTISNLLDVCVWADYEAKFSQRLKRRAASNNTLFKLIHDPARASCAIRLPAFSKTRIFAVSYEYGCCPCLTSHKTHHAWVVFPRIDFRQPKTQWPCWIFSGPPSTLQTLIKWLLELTCVLGWSALELGIDVAIEKLTLKRKALSVYWVELLIERDHLVKHI